MNSLLIIIDSYVIKLYRITGIHIADFLIGTFVLAVLSVAAGELSVHLLRKVNRNHLDRLDREMSNKHELSMEARRSGDMEGYHELNREANDAFGRVFFNMFTFSAASLWSAFMALAWMQMRFREIEFPIPVRLPILGDTVGYVFIFLLLYIFSRIIFGNLKSRLSAKIAGARAHSQGATVLACQLNTSLFEMTPSDIVEGVKIADQVK